MELPKITDAQGTEHTMRRLGYDFLFDAAAVAGVVLSRGGAELGTRLQAARLDRVESFIVAAALGCHEAREPLARLLASVLGVTVEQCQDPKLFPLPVVAEVLLALLAHPDLVAVAGTLGQGNMAMLEQFLLGV